MHLVTACEMNCSAEAGLEPGFPRYFTLDLSGGFFEMFNINSERFSGIVVGIGCLSAAIWLAIRTNHWVAQTWYTGDGSLVLPVMSALMAITLVATGFATLFRQSMDDESEHYPTAEELSREPLYE